MNAGTWPKSWRGGGAALAVCDTIVLPGAEALPQKLALILRETPGARQAQFGLQGGRPWDAVLIPNPEGHWQPKTPLVLRKAHLHVPVEGGESLADLWRRLGPVADTILALQNRRQHVAVVAHFWSLRLLAGLLRRQGLEAAAAARDIRLRNGAVVMLCEGTAPAELQAARAGQVLAIR